MTLNVADDNISLPTSVAFLETKAEIETRETVLFRIAPPKKPKKQKHTSEHT